MAERRFCIPKVKGSIPLGSTHYQVDNGVAMEEIVAQEIVAKALYELQMMRTRDCFDYGKLKSILEGKA